MTSLASEQKVVQETLIRYAIDIGWDYISPADAVQLRGGKGGTVFYDILVEQLQRLNPGVVDASKAENLVGKLIRVRPSVEGNLDAWEYLRGLKTVFVPAEKRERNVRLVDVGNPGLNAFHVTDEFSFTNGSKTIRPDVVLLVNGIPVVVVEAKAATKKGGIAAAFDQLGRYHREGPELMALTQLQTLTQLVRFYYGATWSFSPKFLFDWRDETAGDYESLVKSFLDPTRVLRVITDFILFTRTDEELAKVVLRPHQIRAVDRVLERAADEGRARGLVWHTQGSGKTYSMIIAAKNIIESPVFENPTVLMLVDRNELEAQLFANLEAVGFGHVETAESKRHLQELLTQDRRGLIVSTIHKFDGMPPQVTERDNVVVLVDEAHRTTGGHLGNYLMGALPNATFIGFTGTPIDRSAHGKGTFKVFGGGDVHGYLDKYSIRESITDGTTVPLHYALAPNDLRVDRDVLEREFLALAELEGVSEIEELDRVLQRAVTLRNMLKNPDRVERVAAFVAVHFRTNVEPMGFKAFLVGVDRAACCRLKEALDRHLPPEYSQVVISASQNDHPDVAAFHISDEVERQVRRSFRKPDELPKIMIVTEKLLTGFDAPILYAMYLDKPMRDHVLLQAIARVNRPHADSAGRLKTSGFVLDFVGIFEKLERALAFDSEDLAGVVEDLDVLRRQFERLMGAARASYLLIGDGLEADKLVEAFLLAFRDADAREAFFGSYRELEELYEILSPDAFLREYVDDFGRLSEIYQLLRASYEPDFDVAHSFLRKTSLLVQEMTHTGEIRSPDDIYVLDEGVIDAVANSDKPDTVKVFNLLKVIHQRTRDGGSEAPYLLPIGERAEQIATAFEDRQLSTQQALEELTTLLNEAREADASRDASDFSIEGFSVFWLLQRIGVRNADAIARNLEEVFGEQPHWRQSAAQERDVRRSIYKALIDANVVDVADVVGYLLSVLRQPT
jgi:type I restriction enzyme, R subunit